MTDWEKYLAFGGDMRSLRFKEWALAVGGGENQGVSLVNQGSIGLCRDVMQHCSSELCISCFLIIAPHSSKYISRLELIAIWGMCK
jgi:hypothetical protein